MDFRPSEYVQLGAEQKPGFSGRVGNAWFLPLYIQRLTVQEYPDFLWLKENVIYAIISENQDSGDLNGYNQ